MMETDFLKQIEAIKAAGKRRDYPEAIARCTELLSQTDQYPEALLFLGRSHHALRQFDRALYAFQFFLRRRPDNPLGLFFIGRTFAALGLYKRAIQALKKVLEKDPAFAPALSFLGLAYLKLRRPERSLVYFEQALKSEPANQRIRSGYLNALLVQAVRLFYRKDLEDAARMFEFIEQERPDNILPCIYLAVIAREFGNYPAALRYYDKALTISGDDPVFRLHKAHLYLQLGREDEAWSELKRARGFVKEDLAGAGDPKKLLKMIAVTHYRQARYREAIYFGKQVLKADYRDLEMHVLLAQSYRHFGDLVKAKNHYRRAAEIDRGRPEIFTGLASVLWETGDYAELLALSRRWFALVPGDPSAAYYQVLAKSELDPDQEALIPLLQEQLRVHGPDPELTFSLGRSYVESGRSDLAEHWLQQTLALVADHQAALLLLDEVYEDLKKPAEQIRILQTYCELFPDELELHKKVVRLLLQTARYEEAAAGLQKLVTRQPANRSLRRALGMAYIKSRKYSDAFLVWKELAFREPDSPFPLRQLIYCLAKMKKFKIAIFILDKAARFMKNEVSLLLPLGVLYARTKQFEKANETFRKVIGLNVRDWRAYHNLAMLARRTGNRPLAENFLERARQFKAQTGKKGKR